MAPDTARATSAPHALDKGVVAPVTAREVAPGTAPGGFGSGRAAERRADTARDLEEMDDAQAVLEKESSAERPVACPQRRVACLPAAAAAAAHDGATVSMRRLGGAASAAAAAATGGSVGARDGAGSDAPATAPHAPDDAAGRVVGLVGVVGMTEARAAPSRAPSRASSRAEALSWAARPRTLRRAWWMWHCTRVGACTEQYRAVPRGWPPARARDGARMDRSSRWRAAAEHRTPSGSLCGAVLGTCMRVQLGMRATSHSSASSSSAAKLTSSGATRK